MTSTLDVRYIYINVYIERESVLPALIRQVILCQGAIGSLENTIKSNKKVPITLVINTLDVRYIYKYVYIHRESVVPALIRQVVLCQGAIGSLENAIKSNKTVHITLVISTLDVRYIYKCIYRERFGFTCPYPSSHIVPRSHWLVGKRNKIK